jgi:hypothetical protein
MLPEPGHWVSIRESALSITSSIPLRNTYIRLNVIDHICFLPAHLFDVYCSPWLQQSSTTTSGIMSSRNTQDDAQRQGPMSPGQDIKYGIDESSE